MSAVVCRMDPVCLRRRVEPCVVMEWVRRDALAADGWSWTRVREEAEHFATNVLAECWIAETWQREQALPAEWRRFFGAYPSVEAADFFKDAISEGQVRARMDAAVGLNFPEGPNVTPNTPELSRARARRTKPGPASSRRVAPAKAYELLEARKLA